MQNAKCRIESGTILHFAFCILHFMKHRFFIPHVLASGAVVALEGDELHDARVVRVHEGEEVEVFDGRGGVWMAAVRELPSVELLRALDADREPRVALHLAMAI